MKKIILLLVALSIGILIVITAQRLQNDPTQPQQQDNSAPAISAPITSAPITSAPITSEKSSPTANPSPQAVNNKEPTQEVSPIQTPITQDTSVAEQAISPLSPLSVPVDAGKVSAQSSTTIAYFTYQIINRYPHDSQAFTQGLVHYNGFLYEGTGLEGRSSLRKVALESGTVLEQLDLPSNIFGEGITIFDNRIIQLSWQNHQGFIWDFEDAFQQVKTYRYPTEGWGITHDGNQLIMSDGSDNLYFWDSSIMLDAATKPTTLRRLPVRANGEAVVRLNELEYLQGEILANIWQTDQIAQIDPNTGNVTGWIDLTGLLSPQERANSDVLNGIAYDTEHDRLFVTGKLWPTLFEIKLIPVEGGK